VASGEAILKVAPDRAFLTIEAETRARGPQDAQRQNAEAMASVQGKLKGAKLAQDAIRTLTYNVQPEFDFPNGRRTLRGYVATNAIEVRVDDVGRVGEILDLAVGAGATTVTGIRFDLKDRQGIERQALRQAAADALARAEAVAAGAGRGVDRVLRIEEHRVGAPPPRPVFMARADTMAAEAATTPVSPGEIEIRASVSLTAQLK
jgi:uncharacterized protein YggE